MSVVRSLFLSFVIYYVRSCVSSFYIKLCSSFVLFYLKYVFVISLGGISLGM